MGPEGGRTCPGRSSTESERAPEAAAAAAAASEAEMAAAVSEAAEAEAAEEEEAEGEAAEEEAAEAVGSPSSWLCRWREWRVGWRRIAAWLDGGHSTKRFVP